MVLTYLTLLILFVVPLGLETYLRGISSVTEEQLAAFTVTSPFSAAPSVPMHTTQKRRCGAISLWPCPIPVLVRITGNFGLPVWAIFLCIYPPLCLGLLGVTYLAFQACAGGAQAEWVRLSAVERRRLLPRTRVLFTSSRTDFAPGWPRGSVPFSRYHILSGPRTRVIDAGMVWIGPAERRPRTETLTV